MSQTRSTATCPACGARGASIFYEVQNVPVHSVIRLTSRARARAFPTGDVALAFCRGCGFIHNAAFDPARVSYSTQCEETQGFSATFRDWHRGLAERLIQRHGLRGKRVLEIGCGKGEFLDLICALGPNEGVGYDPAYVMERGAQRPGVQFVAELYERRHGACGADLVCCKMTLEHVADVDDFVAMVREALDARRDAVAFFQVPEARRILEESAFWDVYYEHCSYFTAGALSGLFERRGFAVLDVACEYGGQYLTLEARAGGGASDPARPDGALADLVESAAERLRERVERWRRTLADWRARERRVAVWGSGSKGVAFLTSVAEPGTVGCVVDINPYRQGCFMPTTGEPIVGPESLRAFRPDAVVLMNPIYENEVAADLARLGLAPEVLVP